MEAIFARKHRDNGQGEGLAGREPLDGFSMSWQPTSS
jgi:hypothetical protein